MPSAPRSAVPVAPASPGRSPASAAPGGGAAARDDLDGDGRADAISLQPVPGLGWSFDVRLTSTGELTSAPLPADAVVDDQPEVLGSVDLDRDGRAEVLVRTLTAASGGDVRVVFRLDQGGVWLVRDAQDQPWELAPTGSTTGPRSYDCAEVAASRPGREVRTLDSAVEDTDADPPTYGGEITTWSLSGHAVTQVGVEEFAGVPAASERLLLDEESCAR